MNYKCLLTEEISENKFSYSITERDINSLPSNNTLIKVHYSSLNYKDALSAKGHKGITRNYPHTPGVDAAGIIEKTSSKDFKIGDEVIITGHDLGMNTSGGFAEYISVPEEWLVRKPENLSLKEAMIIGTAGMTAAICVNELIKHNIEPDKGKILVTGATGGVGSMAIGILSKLNYEVTASTGKLYSESDFLRMIGATEIIQREEVNDKSGKPLLKKRWLGAIDTVGGNTLSTILRSLDHHGSVCVLGLVESPYLEINVFPFLQRGVNMLGIDSAERGIELKRELWQQLAKNWKPENLHQMYREVRLDDVIPEIEKILKGKQVGKVIINCKD